MNRPARCLFALAALLPFSPDAGAQVTIGPDGVPRQPGESAPPPPRTGPEVVEWAVSPAALPDPALKYRLVVPAADRRPGSAATYWYRAELLYFESELTLEAQDHPARDRWGTASELLEEPPASLTADRIGKELALGDFEGWSVFGAAEGAARRAPAEWGFGLDEATGRESVEFLLPEFQNARALAQLIALRGRARVGRGDWGGRWRTRRSACGWPKTAGGGRSSSRTSSAGRWRRSRTGRSPKRLSPPRARRTCTTR